MLDPQVKSTNQKVIFCTIDNRINGPTMTVLIVAMP